MKALTERTCKREHSWVGGGYVMCRQRWEIEASDVGHERRDYLGKSHAIHKFVEADVGKEIEVCTDHIGYHSWYFIHHEGLKTQKTP